MIEFYRAGDAYGCFSNFSRHSVHLDHKRWPTTEHYFQAKKFEGTHHEEEIRRAKSPGDAARMGRSRKRPLRRDWEQVKDDVMYRALRAKFTQHEALKAQLLATNDERLVEHTQNDSYWGDGGDGSGRNMLGRLLMRLREALRREGE